MVVSYSAMNGGNLKAVDRVVRIVRELDRYHGFSAPAGGGNYAGFAPAAGVPGAASAHAASESETTLKEPVND